MEKPVDFPLSQPIERIPHGLHAVSYLLFPGCGGGFATLERSGSLECGRATLAAGSQRGTEKRVELGIITEKILVAWKMFPETLVKHNYR